MLKKLVCLLLFIASLASAYTLDGGGGVSWSNQYGTISQYPANLTDILNTVYLNVTSNITGTLNIDTAFEFDTSVIKPLNALYWASNVPHEVPTYGNITWQAMCMDSNLTCNYSKIDQNGTTTVYFDDWIDISNKFVKRDYNEKTYYIIENVSFSKGQTRQLKLQVQVNPNTAGKYGLYLKRSSDSWSDVLSALAPSVYLDPWWNSTFLKRINLTLTPESTYFNDNTATRWLLTNTTMMNDMGVNGASLRYVVECGGGNYTQRPLWIQKWNAGVNASIWLNATNVSYCTHSIYYNSSTATSVSSPYQVFWKYDDFESNTVNTTTWSCYNTACPYQLGNGWMEVSGNVPLGAYGIYTKTNLSRNYTAFVEYNQRTTTGKEFLMGGAWNGGACYYSYYLDALGIGLGDSRINTYIPRTNVNLNNGSLVTVLDSRYLLEYSTFNYSNGTLYFNLSRQITAGDEIGSDIFTPINQTAYVYPLILEFIPGYVGTGSSNNVSLYWVGITPGEKVAYVSAYTPLESTATSIAVSNVTLLNNTFGYVGTPYYNNPTALNASGNCTGTGGGVFVYTGNFTFYQNGTINASYMTYNWLSGTINYTNTSIPGTDLIKGNTWYVVLNCSNATAWNTTTSLAITINNTRPTLTAPNISSSNGSFLITSLLTCNNGTFADTDPSDSLNMSGYTPYRWFRNGTVMATQTNATLNVSWLPAVHAGENFSCEQRAYDIGYSVLSATTNSTNVTISSNPTLTIVTYDENTYARIYFDVVISNSTSSNTTTNQFTYQQQLSTIPLGAVTLFISNSSAYYPRTYYTTLDQFTNYSLSAYLLPMSANTISVNFYTETLNGQFISGATVLIEKSVNSSYVTVGQMVTDASGIAHFWLDQTTSYRITASHPSYNTVSQSITPTLTSYAIYMTSANATGTFESSWYDITWDFSPLGLLNGNYTQNFSFSSHSNNNSIVWTAWAIYNYSTLLHFDNQTGASGTSLTYSFKPGPNASIVVYFYIMHTNQSLQSLAQWWLPINSFFPNYILYRNLQQALGDIGTSGFLHPITIALIGIIVGVMVAGWVAQFSMSGGVVSFLSILGLTMYIGGAGAFISGATVLIAMLTVGAYYLWRSGG